MNPNFNADGEAVCPACNKKIYLDIELQATVRGFRVPNNNEIGFSQAKAIQQGDWYIKNAFCSSCGWSSPENKEARLTPRGIATLAHLVVRMGKAVDTLTKWYCNDGPFEGAHIDTEHPLTLSGQETYELAISSHGLEEDKGPDVSILEEIQ